MLSEKDREKSFRAVREFAEAAGGSADSFYKKVTVTVQADREYIYRDIDMSISYNYGYMDYQVKPIWEDDEAGEDYRSLGLHGQYSSNFQLFSFLGGALRFEDGDNTIRVFAK